MTVIHWLCFPCIIHLDLLCWWCGSHRLVQCHNPGKSWNDGNIVRYEGYQDLVFGMYCLAVSFLDIFWNPAKVPNHNCCILHQDKDPSNKIVAFVIDLRSLLWWMLRLQFHEMWCHAVCCRYKHSGGFKFLHLQGSKITFIYSNQTTYTKG